mgnify:CR=1 FL=1
MRIEREGGYIAAFFNGAWAVFEDTDNGFHQAIKWLEGLL